MCKRKLALVSLLLVLLAACGQPAPTSPPESAPVEAPPETSPGAVPASPTSTTEPAPASPTAGAGQPAPASMPGLPLPMDRGALFSASGACTVCHKNNVDAAGNDVSIESSWRSTMLANAARDPYWLATVRSEVNLAPHIEGVIQKKCATCHMPMAEVTLVSGGQDVGILDQGLKDAAHPLHNLAADGVSCTLCHQVEPDNLGQPGSFSGGFLIDTQLLQGERMAYGPFQTGANLVLVMQGSSGFIPQQGLHMDQSEVCGSCHDLYTPYLDSAGEVAGEFPEQLIYSEWANSAFKDSISCQDCHMQRAEGSVQLSITGGPPRQPFFQHIFAGGNAYMLRMIQQDGEALQVTAAAEQFEASIARTTDQISSKTARLSIRQPRVENGALLAEIFIENLTGHKFPAGYPSRRAWLHVRVLDKDGNPIFESGAVSESGAISGNDNDTDAETYEPHHTLLTSPEQVQIYEGIMIDSDGKVTTRLLRGAQFIKDNRLLPAGYQPNPSVPGLAPQGEAALDADFLAGTDTLSLQIALGQAQGPFTLEVEVLYQTIAFRWAQNLLEESGAEVEHFGRLYAGLPNLPLTAAAAQVTVP